jgi:MFS family permease
MIYAAMTAGTHPAAMAYVTKLKNEKERVSSIALISSSYSIGLVVGPVLVFVYQSGNVLSPVYLISYLAIIFAIASIFILKDSPPNATVEVKEHKNSSLKFWDRRILPTLISLMLVNVIFSCLQQSLGFLTQDLFLISGDEASRKTGVILSTFALAMLFTQVILIQRYKINYKIMIYLGIALVGVGLVCLTFATVYIDFVAIILSIVITGVGIGYLIPSLQTHLTFFVLSNEQGKVAGYIFSFSAMGYVIGPLLGTGLIGIATWLPYLMCLALLTISASCLLIGSKEVSKKTLAMG